jgi:hypothetical protein
MRVRINTVLQIFFMTKHFECCNKVLFGKFLFLNRNLLNVQLFLVKSLNVFTKNYKLKNKLCWDCLENGTCSNKRQSCIIGWCSASKMQMVCLKRKPN